MLSSIMMLLGSFLIVICTIILYGYVELLTREHISSGNDEDIKEYGKYTSEGSTFNRTWFKEDLIEYKNEKELEGSSSSELIAIAMDYVTGDIGLLEDGKPNYERAKKIFCKVASRGDKDSFFAQCMLGCLYHLGDIGRLPDGNPNYLMAKKWYKKAANQGCEDATYRLGILYQEGHIGASRYGEPNIRKARDYYERAAKSGSLKAAFDLSLMYIAEDVRILENGRTNHEYALIYCKKAAESGIQHAQGMLALWYKNGYIRNYENRFLYKEAKFWYNKLIEQGVKGCYEYPENLNEEGKLWINKLIELGIIDIEDDLEDLNKEIKRKTYDVLESACYCIKQEKHLEPLDEYWGKVSKMLKDSIKYVSCCDESYMADVKNCLLTISDKNLHEYSVLAYEEILNTFTGEAIDLIQRAAGILHRLPSYIDKNNPHDFLFDDYDSKDVIDNKDIYKMLKILLHFEWYMLEELTLKDRVALVKIGYKALSREDYLFTDRMVAYRIICKYLTADENSFFEVFSDSRIAVVDEESFEYYIYWKPLHQRVVAMVNENIECYSPLYN